MRCILIGLFIIVDSDIGEIQNLQFQNTSNVTDVNDTVCTDYSNLTLSPFTRRLLCIFLIIQTICSLGLEIFEVALNYRRRHAILRTTFYNKSKKIFLQYTFYRFVHSCVLFLICVRSFATLIGLDPRNDFIAYSRIAIRSICWWSILYFIQLVPGADFFIVAVQSMLGILSQFCLIYVLFLIGYTQLFMIAININLKHGCAIQFTDVPTAIYSTFISMINMLDFTQFDVTNPIALYLIHFIYVLFVGILLLNFLVAIMSDRITETSKYKDVILPMQKLSVVMTIEKQLKFFGLWYYRWIQKKVYTIYNGRLCIVIVSFNRRKDSKVQKVIYF
jgi:hypothetical protein